MYGNEQTDPLWNEATKRKNINLWLKKTWMYTTYLNEKYIKVYNKYQHR